MKNEVKIFENEELSLKVRTILNPDGSISVSAEDTAIGFGWTQTQVKNGKRYTSIRWETLNGYCRDLGFPNLLGKDDFIPESLYYLLGMKANNERAQKYQRWLAIEVLPALRKTGFYQMPSQNTNRPACIEDVLIQSLQEMKDIRAKVDRQSEEMKAVKDAMITPATEENFSEWVSKTIGNIANSPDYSKNPYRYQTAWGESYKRLQDKAGCRLDVLLKNAKKRAEERGASKSKIKAISKLSVIEADKRLKALYITVLQEMAVAYCVEVA